MCPAPRRARCAGPAVRDEGRVVGRVVEALFEGAIEPGVATAAPVFGRSDPLAENLFRQGLLRCTAPWSLVGWPVVSVPCGFEALVCQRRPAALERLSRVEALSK
jgi:Asp-tRNA(Asn)/Glu-tRNA(Gln) amidotransferase A subunit family amidase